MGKDDLRVNQHENINKSFKICQLHNVHFNTLALVWLHVQFLSSAKFELLLKVEAGWCLRVSLYRWHSFRKRLGALFGIKYNMDRVPCLDCLAILVHLL